MNAAQQAMNLLLEKIDQSVIGQHHVARSIVIGLITNGHILLEGLPGTAKTRSVKALAGMMDARFGRVQFTPDLLPSDVTGTDMYQEDSEGKPQLTFQAGPIFNNILLADEINRAPAKVQAALLEAMAEGTVTVGDSSRKLPEPFIVLATQNPIEQEGTYPLPEAQIDRFMLKVTVDYPEDDAELDIVRLVRAEEKSQGKMAAEQTSADARIDPQLVLDARNQLADIHVSEVVERYIVNLVMATRHPDRYPDTKLSEWIEIGSSPRASIALDKCARACAWLAGRDHVEPDDVRMMAKPVLGHRLNLGYSAAADGVTKNEVIQVLLDHVLIG
ncbi:MoxR family ATPase [Photobacterium sp. GJ3]|uniref:AAA family ATPase n=1 Tax=Photobacterium sp. GJ3 TaxID=2829502 RepID=UPI001B8D6CF3|nr:MoxR family ATPase [Photobacterium sp. GJ3]QUJ68339.1 MoxR family ATPase [Photobacterium sp. GJ3]